MIRVYFETKGNSYCELVAVFADDETYNKCLPALKKQAKKNGFKYVTESVIKDDIDTLQFSDELCTQ